MLLAGLPASNGLRAQERSPNEKLNLACVGVNGKGLDNIQHLNGENIAILCDVDAGSLDKVGASYPKAVKYRDYRVMFEKEKNIDGVVVSTADHSHAIPTALAITLGKPVYCEKPLTHTVAEARHIAKLTAQHKVVTQMGTQIHAGGNYRRVVELIRAGAIGAVSEVYCWCNKGWSDGKFGATKPVPATLDWDLWLGPAEKRDYCEGLMAGDEKHAPYPIHPANWRRFWEYGSGTFGDMACHIMDLPYWALGLRYPQAITAEGPPVHATGAPKWVKCSFEFAESKDHPALKLFWSDGGAHFDAVKATTVAGKPVTGWGLGILFVGSKGKLVADYDKHHLLPEDQFKDFKRPEKSIPDSIGHWNEFAKAIKNQGQTTCHFGYSALLTECVLLGVVAYRSGVKVEYDVDRGTTSNEQARKFLTKSYRKGFEIAGL
jgi:predicted dehydrogenase